MEQRRRQTTVEQWTLLVEFLEQRRDLALGRLKSKEARALSARLWRECSLILNSEGPARTGKEWAKVWNDLKCRVRAKLVAINASHQATGGGPSTAASLTPIEEKIANILGRDVGPLPNVRQDPFATHNETNEENIYEELVVDDQLLNLEIQIDPDVQGSGGAHVERLESPVHESVAPESAALSPTLITGQVPPSPGTSGDRNILRRQSQRDRRAAARPSPISPPPPAQSNRTALEESRSMLLQIEKMRAEAALNNSEANKAMAIGFQQLSASIDRFTRQYVASAENAPREEN